AGISALGRHVLDPGRQLIANVDLAGAGAAAKHPGAVRHVPSVLAPEKYPVRALSAETFLRALVDLEVVGEDRRARAVDDVRERDGVMKHPLGRALEPERVRVDDRAVHRDRMHDPELTKLTHERAVGIDDAVPAQLTEHARRAIAPQAPLEG